MSEKKYEQQRISNGKCRNCGSRPAKKGATTCTHCLRQKALTQNDLYRDRLSRGLCPNCGKRPPYQDRWACGPCLEQRREATRRYREKIKNRSNKRFHHDE